MPNGKDGKNPKPPKGLSREARQLWADLHRQFNIDCATKALVVRTACDALDRLRGAQAAIKRDGLTVIGRYGSPVINPVTVIERSSRHALMTALAEIGYEGSAD
jgi:phage terminase small subunit